MRVLSKKVLGVRLHVNDIASMCVRVRFACE